MNSGSYEFEGDCNLPNVHCAGTKIATRARASQPVTETVTDEWVPVQSEDCSHLNLAADAEPLGEDVYHIADRGGRYGVLETHTKSLHCDAESFRHSDT